MGAASGRDAKFTDQIRHAARRLSRAISSRSGRVRRADQAAASARERGFDAHREDPIGSLGLEVDDFAELTKYVLDVAQVHAGGRIVSLLEGGYKPDRLAECVAEHLRLLQPDG